MLGDFALTRVDGSGGRLEASTLLVFPQLRITETEASHMFLFNPSPNSRSEVQLRVLDPVGIQIGSGAFSLDPMGSRTGSLQEMIAHRLQLEEGYLVVESSIPVQGLVVKQHPEHLTMVPGLRSSPKLSVTAAHFFWGPLGTTELRLLNLEPESTRYRISDLARRSGRPSRGTRGSRTWRLDDDGPQEDLPERARTGFGVHTGRRGGGDRSGNRPEIPSFTHLSGSSGKDRRDRLHVG